MVTSVSYVLPLVSRTKWQQEGQLNKLTIKLVSIFIFISLAITLTVGIVSQVVRFAGLANLVDVESVIPCLEILFQVGNIVRSRVFQDGRNVQLPGVIVHAARIGVQTEPNARLGHGFGIVVQLVAILVGLSRRRAVARPKRPLLRHEAVLVVRPQANTLVLEQLLHPFVVVWFFEEAQQLKMRALEMAVHLGTATRLCNAGSFVPGLFGAIVKLVFTNASSRIVGVNVLCFSPNEMDRSMDGCIQEDMAREEKGHQLLFD